MTKLLHLSLNLFLLGIYDVIRYWTVWTNALRQLELEVGEQTIKTLLQIIQATFEFQFFINITNINILLKSLLKENTRL